jgi:Ca2+-binding RTX toxin-like protein
LAFSLPLVDAARKHSQWMLNTNTFSHAGSGGSDPGTRMRAAGYAFTGSWTWGENISWSGTTGTPNVSASVAQQHDNLFYSAGHRTNILKDDFKEIGLGVLTGQYSGYNYGYAGNDVMDAGAGNDQLYGGTDNDTLRGGTGNDKLYGEAGNDSLIGVNASSTTPGRGEIDQLTGGGGRDRFHLGDANRFYYGDGNASVAGVGDYALITDFKQAEGDVIQLKGVASSYRLGSSPVNGLSGTAVFVKTSGVDELIGIVQGVTNLSLSSAAFIYV